MGGPSRRLRAAAREFVERASRSFLEELAEELARDAAAQEAADGGWEPGPRALRFNSGKPMLSRLLCFPASAAGKAKVTEFGERKYAQYNFCKGAPLSESLDCVLRHMFRYWCRVNVDPETDLMELNALAWNADRAANEAQMRPRGYVDDRPPAGTFNREAVLALFSGTFPGQVLRQVAPPAGQNGSACASSASRSGSRKTGSSAASSRRSTARSRPRARGGATSGRRSRSPAAR